MKKERDKDPCGKIEIGEEKKIDKKIDEEIWIKKIRIEEGLKRLRVRDE